MISTAFALWGMARPLIMSSVVLVYIDGLLIARAHGYAISGEKIIWGLAALLLISLSIHYANEYADYETDALTRPTRYSGGSGVLARGDVPRILALQAAWVTLTLGFAVAVIGFWVGVLSLIAVIFLIIGAFGGWMYSLPPLKLAWRGWGELDNALLGGMLLHLYGYVVLGARITPGIVAVFVPFTLLAFNNLLATTWADREADSQVGKNTLATQFSAQQLRRLYAAVAIAAFALLPLLGGWALPSHVVHVSFLALPFVFWGWRTYTRLHVPYPTSNAMMVWLLAQMIAWSWQGSFS